MAVDYFFRVIFFSFLEYLLGFGTQAGLLLAMHLLGVSEFGFVLSCTVHKNSTQ